MVKSIIIILIMFVETQFSNCQIIADTAFGEVGDELLINLQIPGSIPKFGNNKVSGELWISNPTVFYPDSFTNVNSYFLIDTVLNINDTAWYFNFEFDNNNDTLGNIIIQFWGEALAGTDSICTLRFGNVKINEEPVTDFDANILTHTSGTPLPYIRFAKLYPNPVEGSNSIKWHYIIDKPSIVEFYILDYRAKETFLINLGLQSTGIHEFIFTPEMGFSSGLYWMKLKTNTGESVAPFMIVK